jgi:hypothetical protein
MKKLIASLLITMQLFAAAPALADPPTLPDPPAPVPGEVDVGAAISPMKKGQVAPFTGILLSPKAAATVIAELNNFEARVKVEVDHAVAVNQAQCDFKLSEQKTTADADKKVLNAQLEERNKRIDILNGIIKKQEEDRPNVMLWTGLGVAGGVIITLGTVLVVGVAQK